jgi:hypothetical protein
MTIKRPSFEDTLIGYVQAGFQALECDTPEITRAENSIRRVAEQLGMNVYTWDVANGCNDDPPTEKKSPQQALDRVSSSVQGDGIFIFRNFHIFLRDPTVAQKWQLLVEQNMLSNAEHRCPVIILGTNVEMPKMLAATTTKIDFKLPTRDELETCFDFIHENAIQANPNRSEQTECPAEQRDKIIDSLRGLNAADAENVLSLCVIKHNGFADPVLMNTIEDEKAKILKRTNGLEYIHKDRIAEITDVGGFDLLKAWIEKRKVCFTPAAAENHIDPLKGVVLIGPPGTGKSLFGKVCAKVLEQPLVIADISSVFGSLVGQSEKQMDEMLASIDAMESAVILWDEADKMFSGAKDATGDSGVTRRIFGKALTWLQEKTSNVFVVMTMNSIAGIPPEFLRKGRFDEIFYTDLPAESERREIFEIHFKKRGVEDNFWSETEWEEVIKLTKNFVGSEIEDAVKTARLTAFTERGSGVPTFEEMKQCVKETITLAQLDKENIESIRKFCADRARPVSTVSRDKSKSGKSRNVTLT